MTYQEFSKILNRRIELVKQVLDKKAEEYAQVVCVRDLAYGKLKATSETIDEKIGDAINYLILLEGLLREKR